MLAATLTSGPVRRDKYLDALTTAFVVILLVSNLVAQKICLIGPWPSAELKVRYEVTVTPRTYLVIYWLKSAEGADAFDRHENFNPFSFAMTATGQVEPSDS